MESKSETVILICGLSGSGKSVVAKKVAKKLKLRMVHTSGVLKQVISQQEKNFSKAAMNKGFWESKKGKEFNAMRLKDQSMDKELDKALLQLIRKGKVVMDSWTMPWLSNKGIKIWLKVSEKVRAKRLAERDKLSAKEVMKHVRRKENEARAVYRKAYGFEFGKDLKPFQLIVDVDKLSLKEVVQKILEFVKEKTSTKA
ncbi:MAG: cytidylate kinase family protein [Candidatus Diapherotrites archaeon]|nr:cytidylate kinase family protein [Candidatus Diapherotrites archaeon]